MIRRLIGRVTYVLKLALLCTIVVGGYVAWANLTDREMVWPVSAVFGAERTITGSDPDFSDLEVTRDVNALYDGTVVVSNPSGSFQEVVVTVDLFDGDQNVGDLIGSITLKPRSEATVDLRSGDVHARWTEAYVDLLRMPA